MKTILVLTGAAGFIGYNFLAHFVTTATYSKYSSIILIDKMGYATTYNDKAYRKIVASHGKLLPYEMNINDLQADQGEPDVHYDILNFASNSHVDNSIITPSAIYYDNVNIPARLIDHFGMSRIRKFVQISTDEVYGDLDYSLKDNFDMWFKPDSPFLPNNPYAASKAAQDCYLRSMEHTFGMNVVTVRMANQFGSWQHPEKMLPATIGRILSNQSIKIYGEGKNIRQWTPVSQTVNHIRNILETENATTIHLGADQSLLTNNSVVEMWRKIMLYKYRIESKVEYIIDRKGHDKMYAIQPTLKYAYTNLDKEFEETLAHYVDREEHYKRE